MNVSLQAVPGPGKYDIKSQFDQDAAQPSDAAEKPPFGTAATVSIFF